jgi:uncharacterized protein
MRRLTFVLIVSALPALPAAQQPASVPPPAWQHTADCARPVYATDQLVCEDPQLRAIDRQLADLYDRVADSRASAGADGPERPHLGTNASSLLLESDLDWFRRRSLCAFRADHRDCAIAAYRERLAVIGMLDAWNGRTPPLELMCGDRRLTAGWGTPATPAGAPGEASAEALLIVADESGARGVAMPAGVQAWMPYLRYARTGRTIRLISPAGQMRACSGAGAVDAPR